MLLPFGNPAFPTDLSTPLLRLSPKDLYTLEDAVRGQLILGGIGSGKTSASGLYLASTYLSNGFGGLICAVKQSERKIWIERIRRAGRLNSLIIVDKTAKHKINPISYMMSTSPDAGSFVMNVVNMLSDVTRGLNGGGTGGDSAAFFEANKKIALTHCISLLWAAFGDANLWDVSQIIQSRPADPRHAASAEWQRSFMAHTLQTARDNPRHPMADMDYRQAHSYLTQTFGAQANSRTAGDIGATLAADLGALMQGKVREILGENTTFVPEMAINDGAIILVDLPYETFGDAGLLAQKVIKNLFQKAVLARPRTRDMRPTMLWCDEAHFVATPFDSEFQSLAREARNATTFLTQNLSGVLARVGGARPEDSVHSLFGNFATKIAHANSDFKTNEWFSNMTGKGLQYRYTGGSQIGGSYGTSVQSGSNSSTGGDGKSSHGVSWSFTRQGNLSWNESTGWNQANEYLIEPGSFTRLRTGGKSNRFLVDGIFFRSGSVFNHSGQAFLPVTFNQKL